MHPIIEDPKKFIFFKTKRAQLPIKDMLVKFKLIEKMHSGVRKR
jgi:hypothetical protein